MHALNLELDQTKARTKSKEAEALRKQEGLEKDIDALSAENAQLKLDLVGSLAKETKLNSRIADLEQELKDQLVEVEAAMSKSRGDGRSEPARSRRTRPGIPPSPRLTFGAGTDLSLDEGSSVNTPEFAALKMTYEQRIHALREENLETQTELTSTRQHLEAREEQLNELKSRLTQAQTSVQDRRASMARRDSVGARQAAILSMSISRSSAM